MLSFLNCQIQFRRLSLLLPISWLEYLEAILWDAVRYHELMSGRSEQLVVSTFSDAFQSLSMASCSFIQDWLQLHLGHSRAVVCGQSLLLDWSSQTLVDCEAWLMSLASMVAFVLSFADEMTRLLWSCSCLLSVHLLSQWLVIVICRRPHFVDYHMCPANLQSYLLVRIGAIAYQDYFGHLHQFDCESMPAVRQYHSMDCKKTGFSFSRLF